MILVTGSNGFLGGHLVERMKGENLSLLDRGINNRYPDHPFYQSEINSFNDYSKALERCNTVIHCAARVHVMDDQALSPLDLYRDVNTAGTLNLANQSIKAGVKRFIFISSIKVNGEVSKKGHPFKSSDVHEPKEAYGQSKSEAERQLIELSKTTDLEVVIIRPTLVYGPGVKANFSSLMQLVSKGFPLPFGCITTNRRSLVSIENLVDLIVTCVDHPKAANQVFLVSDDHDVSTSDIIYYMAIALDKIPLQLPVPKWGYKLAGRILGKKDVIDRLLGSLQVDITHTKQTLDWKPPQSLEEGFRLAAEALIRSKKQNKEKYK